MWCAWVHEFEPLVKWGVGEGLVWALFPHGFQLNAFINLACMVHAQDLIATSYYHLPFGATLDVDHSITLTPICTTTQLEEF